MKNKNHHHNGWVYILILMTLTIPFPLHAAPGDLDATFGSGGKVMTDFGDNEIANAIAIQPDGKIVVAGEATYAGRFALARYNPNGSLDSSFGNGGKLISISGSINAVTVQPDGKILVAGIIVVSPGTELFGLARN